MKPVQPIVVNGLGTHEEVVESVVLAVIDCYETSSARNFESGQDQWWPEWLTGAFTKSVRVTKSSAKFVNLWDHAVGRGAAGGSLALAFPPCPEEYWDRDIKIARVAGFERPRTGQWSKDEARVTVCINPELMMSTGKTASQAAHAALAWRVAHGIQNERFSFSDSPEDWSNLNDPMRRLFSSHSAFTVPIIDNGLTEIEPDSLTAIAGLL